MKKYLIAAAVLVVGLVAGFFLYHRSPAPAPSGELSGEYNVSTVGPSNPNGISIGNTDVNYVNGVIKASQAQNTFFWRNTTGKTAYVDLLELSTDGYASSSMKLYAFSTSSPATQTSANAFYAPSWGTGAPTSTMLAINAFSLATSSPATTTSSFSSQNAATSTGMILQVPANYYVNVLVLSACGTQTSTCESATSTRRGFNVQVRLRYHN